MKEATRIVSEKLLSLPNLIDVEDTTPLPGIDWQIDVDVEQAGRYGADVATVGAMVQLLTRGILLDKMQSDSSDEEIEIRVRYPDSDRVLSTLDTMRVRTADGLIPLSNFITRQPVPKLAAITRYQQERYFIVRAGVEPGINAQAEIQKVAAWLDLHRIVPRNLAVEDVPAWVDTILEGDKDAAKDALNAFVDKEFVTPKIEALDAEAADFVQKRQEIWDEFEIGSSTHRDLMVEGIETFVATAQLLPDSVGVVFAGDQEEQAESMAFLGQAFIGALGLMFVILLAQFNSLYNSVVVLLAVILSVTGVLIGMLVMDQTFSIIMTGTGIVALAGIVVNNNIVLIDTYQDYSRYMPRTEAIVRTAEDRIRPVLLTTITTMAGLTPMMLGISVDFANGGYTVDAPTSLWWKSLATAVVFGLGVATILTLVITPSLLALRVWITRAARAVLPFVTRGDEAGSAARSFRTKARRTKAGEIDWMQEKDDAPDNPTKPLILTPSAAAE